MDENKIKKYIVTILVFAALFVYANALPNGFVWDDEEQVANNTVIRDWRNLPLVFASSTFYAGGAGLQGGFYRPLVTLSYFIDYRLWGLNPAGYRFIQLLFHTANVLLVYFLLKIFFAKNNLEYGDLAAGLAALLFAVHPANVESVAYIGSIGEVIYAFLSLWAIIVFIKDVDRLTGKIGGKTLIAVFTLVFFGLLAKETAIVTLPIIFFYLLLFVKFRLGNYIKFFIGSAAAAGLYIFLRFQIARIPAVPADFAPITHASLLERLMTIPYAVLSYLGIIFFPKDLSISRHFAIRSFGDPHFLGALAFLAILIAAAVFYARKIKSKPLIFFLLWFMSALAPALNIIPLDMTMAERWLYIPIIGILGALSIVAVRLVRALPANGRKIAGFLAVILVIVLAVRTITRNENWKDGLALFSHDDAIVDRMSPQGSFDLENNYGVELFRAGLVEQAGEHFKKSISLQPAWASSQNNLGAVLERQGDLEGALAQYRKSITAGNYYLAYENEGGILMKLKRYGEAKTFLEDSLAIFPQNERLQFSLAVIYAADDIGNVADSKQKSMLLLSQVLSQDPQNQRAIQLYLMLKNNQKFEL